MGLIFGQLLRNTREERGLTLRGFAKRLEVSPSYICDIELGHRNPPDTDKLRNIATILGCDIQKLTHAKTLDSGKVTLNFNAGETFKADLAMVLEAEWNNITLEKATLLIMLLAGKIEGVEYD